ncbi:MAG: glycoside hydrolase family 31 protein, partial [Planctomycetota bacterium]|nr:glycoside hydrolase family 31 protein [Planctomycetota bacterium]
WWEECHKVYIKAGISGIWNDMNEPAVFSIEGQEPTREFPLDARHGPYDHEEVHNLYGHKMGEATRRALANLRPEKRPFVLTRSGFSGIQKHAWVWTGDNASSWEHLEMSLPMLLNLGLSGVPFCGADIGGFFQNCQSELLSRWIWLGVFYPFMRNHSGRDRIDQEPWSFNDETTAIAKRAIQFRYELLPTIYSLAKEASDTGLPMMRPCFFLDSSDEESYEIFDQFLFGSNLMVAPALRPGQVCRSVYLPGEWQDFWTGKKIVTEGNWALCRTPLNGIPIFQKSGTAIPTTSSQPHTGLAKWISLRFTVALGNVITGYVFEDDGDGYTEGAVSEVIGTFNGTDLHLEFCNQLEFPRGVDFEILGMPLPQSSSEPCRETERGIEVTWTGKNLKLSWNDNTA